MPVRWLVVPFVQIESFLPKKGLVVDIGCGEGVLAVLSAIAAPKRKVIGIDLNRGKVKLGKTIAKDIDNLSFEEMDVIRQKLPQADAFILSDFLHHAPQSEHKNLLKKIVKLLTKDGILIVKEIDSKDGIRAKISRIFDFLFYPFQKVSFVNSEMLGAFLTSLGLKVSIIKVQKWFPGSTTLFICKK